jgi:cysteinyl-tRNA synthetase
VLRFYNSFSRKKEDFIPLEKGKVKLYTCGPTVYDTAHIGNFRTFLFEDFLKRVLVARGFDVFHVMNITDVDDKTIKKSMDEGKPLSEITNH